MLKMPPLDIFCQGHAIMETVMEHLAAASATDPLALREANMVRIIRVTWFVSSY